MIDLKRITPNYTKNAQINNADELIMISQSINGIHKGNIPTKVVAIDCMQVTGM